MGFFNELGRRVETLKRTAADAAATDASYRCRACDERFEVEHDSCLECGGELVSTTE